MHTHMLLRTLGCLPLQALIEEEALASFLVQNLPLLYFALNTFCKASAKLQLQRSYRVTQHVGSGRTSIMILQPEMHSVVKIIQESKNFIYLFHSASIFQPLFL